MKLKTIKLQENIMKKEDSSLSFSQKCNLLDDSQETLKIRILFITRPIAPPWDEASKNFAYNLAINVAKINPQLEIHLMTQGNLRKHHPKLPSNIIQHPIYTQAENDFSLIQKMRSILFQWKMKNKFDLVQYFFTPSKLNSFLIKNLLYPKKSKTIQTIATLREDLMSNEEIKKSIFGDLLTTYSDYSFKKLKGLGFTQVQRIHPGIDLDFFTPQDKDPQLMKAYGFDKKDFIIGFTGEYVRLGGIDDILESFQGVIKKIPEAKLFLNLRVKNSLDTEKKNSVKQKLKKINLSKKVVFAKKECLKKWGMAKAYNLYDLALFPVHNMNGKFDIPLVVPESMACGKVNIVSNIPILQEFANPNNTVIIEKGNVRQLTEAILDLYQNQEKRWRLSNNGLHFARKNFDIKFIVEEYNEIYKKIIGEF